MKKINEVFKEVESEKKNKVSNTTVSMELDDFIEEHKDLIRILRTGTKEEREAEAAKQEAELTEEIGEEYEDDEEEEEEE